MHKGPESLALRKSHTPHQELYVCVFVCDSIFILRAPSVTTYFQNMPTYFQISVLYIYDFIR